MNNLEVLELAFVEFQKALDERLDEVGRNVITREEINSILNTIIAALRIRMLNEH